MWIDNLSYYYSNYENFSWLVILNGSSVAWKVGYDGSYGNYSVYKNIRDLSPKTTYTVDIKAQYNGTWYPISNNGFAFTTSSARPSNWSWTTAETNAFNNKGAVATLTWDRWNSFIDKIIEFRNYKNLSTYVNVDGTSNSISNAKVTSNNKTLTALKFNITRVAIGEMNSTGISNVVKDGTVYGSYFITLKNSLNGIA